MRLYGAMLGQLFVQKQTQQLLSEKDDRLQLALNAAWTWLFFGRHRPQAALVDIVVLWVVLLVLLIEFWRLEPLAGMLMIPYLAWVSFASALNWSIWRLNPETHTR